MDHQLEKALDKLEAVITRLEQSGVGSALSSVDQASPNDTSRDEEITAIRGMIAEAISLIENNSADISEDEA